MRLSEACIFGCKRSIQVLGCLRPNFKRRRYHNPLQPPPIAAEWPARLHRQPEPAGLPRHRNDAIPYEAIEAQARHMEAFLSGEDDVFAGIHPNAVDKTTIAHFWRYAIRRDRPKLDQFSISISDNLCVPVPPRN